MNCKQPALAMQVCLWGGGDSQVDVLCQGGSGMLCVVCCVLCLYPHRKIAMEEEQPVLVTVFVCLGPLFRKRLISSQNGPMARRHGVGGASFNTPLQSFDCPNTMEEERPSL